MSFSEFDLIERFFLDLGPERADVLLGIGDDCALLRPPEGHDLALSMDTLVAGRHFFPDVDPVSLGHKALAVNLSDLAAMGAEPAWASLALTLPEIDEPWLRGFVRGFAELAQRSGIRLVGGDTTRGPLSITVQVQGLLPTGSGMRRSGAQVGDFIFVSGTLGDAALALKVRQGSLALSGETLTPLLRRLDRPEPRLQLALAVRDIATACIDISDGLGADLNHICRRSGVAALLQGDNLPLSEPVRDYLAGSGDWSLPLGGGDDYELCLTVAPERVAELESRVTGLSPGLHQIGIIEAGKGVRCRLPDGEMLSHAAFGYDHFR